MQKAACTPPEKMIIQVKNMRQTVEGKTNNGNINDVSQRYDGLARKLEFQIYMHLSTFLLLRNPV